MKNKFLLLLWIFLVAAPVGAADFAAVKPGRELQFPRDHGAHPEFQTEWWYFTGHLQDEKGRSYGFQWTVFRSALRPPGAESQAHASPWRAGQIYLGHLALSDLSSRSFAFEEGAARGALGLAGSSEENFQVWLPGFSARKMGDETTVEAKKGEISLELKMKIPDRVWLHGDKGYSPKSTEAGRASYYYSIPNIAVSGKLRRGDRDVAVQGQAWMDHEFGSGQLGSEQSGWDWMGLPLGNGEALMVYRLRDRRNSKRDFLYGGFYKNEGEWESLGGGDLELKAGGLWKSPRSGGEYPLEWQVRVPKKNLDLKIRAAFPAQELDTRKSTQVIYWEGSVEVTGRSSGREVRSQGYLEMTGYARDFEQKL